MGFKQPAGVLDIERGLQCAFMADEVDDDMRTGMRTNRHSSRFHSSRASIPSAATRLLGQL